MSSTVPSSEPAPESDPATVAEIAPVSDPEPVSPPDPDADAVPESVPVPVSELEPVTLADPVSVPDAESVLDPVTLAVPVSVPDDVSDPDPVTDSADVASVPVPVSEPLTDVVPPAAALNPAPTAIHCPDGECVNATDNAPADARIRSSDWLPVAFTRPVNPDPAADVFATYVAPTSIELFDPVVTDVAGAALLPDDPLLPSSGAVVSAPEYSWTQMHLSLTLALIVAVTVQEPPVTFRA
jgi:hypothetical protein